MEKLRVYYYENSDLVEMGIVEDNGWWDYAYIDVKEVCSIEPATDGRCNITQKNGNVFTVDMTAEDFYNEVYL